MQKAFLPKLIGRNKSDFTRNFQQNLCRKPLQEKRSRRYSTKVLSILVLPENDFLPCGPTCRFGPALQASHLLPGGPLHHVSEQFLVVRVIVSFGVVAEGQGGDAAFGVFGDPDDGVFFVGARGVSFSERLDR